MFLTVVKCWQLFPGTSSCNFPLFFYTLVPKFNSGNETVKKFVQVFFIKKNSNSSALLY